MIRRMYELIICFDKVIAKAYQSYNKQKVVESKSDHPAAPKVCSLKF